VDCGIHFSAGVINSIVEPILSLSRLALLGSATFLEGRLRRSGGGNLGTVKYQAPGAGIDQPLHDASISPVGKTSAGIILEKF